MVVMQFYTVSRARAARLLGAAMQKPRSRRYELNRPPETSSPTPGLDRNSLQPSNFDLISCQCRQSVRLAVSHVIDRIDRRLQALINGIV